MYTLFYNEESKAKTPLVYRKGPGCCGGFYLKYEGTLPKENDWIRVLGEPFIESDGYNDNLYLKVDQIEVLTERGAESVNR